MAKRPKQPSRGKKPIEQYEHKGKQRVNNPPVGLVTPDTDPDVKAGQPKEQYQYDPQLVWAGENERWSRLARNLKAEIDEELIEQYRGTVSLPAEPGEHKPAKQQSGRRIAVKIVDDRGIESLKILEI